MTLLRDESLKILTENGTPLVEVRRDDSGPVVRLLTKETSLDVPGELRINAHRIVMNATSGNACIAASDDVIVNGEMIRLN